MSDTGDCAVGTQGLKVVEHRKVNGVSKSRAFNHKALLGSCAGDTPVIKKWSQWSSHASFLGCGFCTLRGVRVVNGENLSGTRFIGYSEPTAFGCPLSNPPENSCLAGDAVCKISDKDQFLRGNLWNTRKKLSL